MHWVGKFHWITAETLAFYMIGDSIRIFREWDTVFGDLNPEAVLREYPDRLIWADFNLKDVKVFVFPNQ